MRLERTRYEVGGRMVRATLQGLAKQPSLLLEFPRSPREVTVRPDRFPDPHEILIAARVGHDQLADELADVFHAFLRNETTERQGTTISLLRGKLLASAKE